MQDQPARPEAPAPVDLSPTHRPSLERRLDALERENRFFRLALLAALFLMPAGTLAAAQSIGALSGTEVAVKDQNGQVRARLEPQGLFLYDGRGKLRASLSVIDLDTPMLGLRDEAGEMRLTVSLFHTHPMITSVDEKGVVSSYTRTDITSSEDEFLHGPGAKRGKAGSARSPKRQ